MPRVKLNRSSLQIRCIDDFGRTRSPSVAVLTKFITEEGVRMKNPLLTLQGTIIAGIFITVVMVLIVNLSF